jgi:hypothetical protein
MPSPQSGRLRHSEPREWCTQGPTAFGTGRPCRGTRLALRPGARRTDARAPPMRSGLPAARPISATLEGKGRALTRLASGRAPATSPVTGPEAAWLEPQAGPPRGARGSQPAFRSRPGGVLVFRALRSASSFPHPDPKSHPARPCSPRASPRGDPGTEEGTPAADCRRHNPAPPLLRLTFKPRQNGAVARVKPERMRERRLDEGAEPGMPPARTRLRGPIRTRLWFCADVTRAIALWALASPTLFIITGVSRDECRFSE